MALKEYEVKNKVLSSGIHYCTDEYKTRNTNRKTHRGIDLVSINKATNKTCCDYVVAIEEGIVEVIGKNATIGNYIMIKHSCGLYSCYYHLKDNTIKVTKNQKVNKGQVLAYMGATGKCTGSHLHFGILTSTSTTSDIDPLPYLKGDKSLQGYEWTTGNYKLIVSKTIRTSTKLDYFNQVKVKECRVDVKPNLTSTRPNDIAMFKVGTIVNITKIIKESNGRVWGKLRTDYIVLCNKDGTPQAQKW